MSIATFIPELWSARILDNLTTAHVYANLVNRDYEGEIKALGDTVHINAVGEVEIKDYDKTTDSIDDADELETTDHTLTISQHKYFNVKIKDVDAVQAAAPLMEKASASAGYGFADKSDTYLAGILAAGTITTGLGTTAAPLVITSENAYTTLIKMKTAMDKADVPKVGRWVVFPPEYEGFMLEDLRFAGGTGTNAESRLKDGAVARAAGFDIYISNNVPNTSNAKYKVIASYDGSCTYAEQILETEAYRPEKGFSDAMKGLHVYGAKVTRAGAIAVATCDFTSTSE
ncbi:MAG: P22 phage major capsid protein family protein [Clostridia bacterium]